MADYPASIDSFVRPLPGDPRIGGTSLVDAYTVVVEAVEELEERVGVDSSADPASHEFRLTELEGLGGNLYSAENKGAADILVGQAVAARGDNGIEQAEADTIGHVAIGLATEEIDQTFSGNVQTDGVMELADWTDATGAADLVPNATYFLSATPGEITTVPPGAGVVQIVGRAATARKMVLEMGRGVRL